MFLAGSFWEGSMQRSELRIYTSLMLAGMLAVLAFLAGAHIIHTRQPMGRYTLTDLGAVAQESSLAHGGAPSVNRIRQKVAWKHLPGGRGVQAYILDHGKRRSLGTLGGKVSYPIALNDAGQVAGYSLRSDQSPHAFLWQDGRMLDLGTLGGRCSWAWDLDWQGHVVGAADTSSGPTQAFVWNQGVMTDLGTLGGGESAARSLNARGQIVGEAETATGDLHAFLYSDGVMTDLNTLTAMPRDWVLTSATRIDSAGRIWGEGIYQNKIRSFLLTPVS